MLKVAFAAIAALGLMAVGCSSMGGGMKKDMKDSKMDMKSSMKDACPESCCKDGKCSMSANSVCACK